MLHRPQRLLTLAILLLLLTTGCAPRASWVYVDQSQQQTIDFKHYPTSATVHRHLTQLPERFPGLVKYEVAGESLLGKPISVLTLTNLRTGNPGDRPALLVIAQQHAREPISQQLALSWIEFLLASYGKDEIITHLLDTRTVYVFPQVNPDGNDVFLADDHFLRGNLRPSDLDMDGQNDEDPKERLGIEAFQKLLVYLKSSWVKSGAPFREGWNYWLDDELANAHFIRHLGWVDRAGKTIRQVDNDGDGTINEDYPHGVDINRNWDIAWLEGDARVNSYTYKGTSPWSEPETRAMRDFVLRQPNIVAALDLHSGVNMLIYPWSVSTERPVDENTLQTLARAGSALTRAPHTMAGDGLYLGYGTAKDWFYKEGIVAITAEIYGEPSVVSYERIWPSNMYVVYTSMAYKFNPPPQDIAATNTLWKPYLTYMLSVLPSYTVKETTALDANTVEVVLANTGYLNPSSLKAIANGKEISLKEDERGHVLKLPLRSGNKVEVLLEAGSLLKFAERPLPTFHFELSREAEAITVVSGTSYNGPSPSTLFSFGFYAPDVPWALDPYYITKP